MPRLELPLLGSNQDSPDPESVPPGQRFRPSCPGTVTYRASVPASMPQNVRSDRSNGSRNGSSHPAHPAPRLPVVPLVGPSTLIGTIPSRPPGRVREAWPQRRDRIWMRLERLIDRANDWYPGAGDSPGRHSHPLLGGILNASPAVAGAIAQALRAWGRRCEALAELVGAAANARAKGE